MTFLADPISWAALAIAAVAGFKLWQVLGRSESGMPLKTGRLTLLKANLEMKAVELAPRAIWHGFAVEGSALAQGLQAIADKDQQFDTTKFLVQARSAHEQILNAFAEGDIKSLSSLLAKSTLDIFTKEIERRKRDGEVSIFKFIRIVKSEISTAGLSGNNANITVAFSTELVSAIKDTVGKVISGDEKAIVRVEEHWTFGSDLGQPQRYWRLFETHEAG